MLTIVDFFMQLYPLLVSGTIDRVEKTLLNGDHIKAYRVVNIVRIDITPRQIDPPKKDD